MERPRRSRSGHLWLELVEKGRGDSVLAKIDAVVFRSDLWRIEGRLRRAGQRLEAGQRIRCSGKLDFYPPSGKLQLVIQDVDAEFTLGDLERQRRENHARLAAAGLLERNAALDLSEVPLEIGLVSSHDSAAYHDFLSGLRASGFAFRVVFVHASVQGRAAEVEIPSAMRLLARRRLDAIALVRGGGSRTDLAAFDSFAIAEAVASCPVPVLTGLGHEIDRSLADLVAHTALKTPTQVAETLIAAMEDAERAVDELRSGLRTCAERRLERARVRVEKSRHLARLAHLRLGAAALRLRELEKRLGASAERGLEAARRRLARAEDVVAETFRRPLRREGRRPEELATRIVALARARLATARARLRGSETLARSLAPERVLERGYSLTTDSEGRVIRRSADVAIGDTISTRLADGTITSRVEAP